MKADKKEYQIPFIYRDALEVLTHIISNPIYRGVEDFNTRTVLKMTADGFSRVFSEILTGEKAEFVQVAPFASPLEIFC